MRRHAQPVHNLVHNANFQFVSAFGIRIWHSVTLLRMRFRVHKLIHAPVGAHQEETLERGVTWFDDTLRVDFIEGDFRFTRAQIGILAEGEFDTQTSVQCVRSLDLFDLPLRIQLEDVVFRLPGQLPIDEDDETPQVDEAGWIDLTETLREHILLAIPINPISPQYQNDDALKKLVDDENADWLTVRRADESKDSSQV
jgi:hypothetical protein